MESELASTSPNAEVCVLKIAEHITGGTWDEQQAIKLAREYGITPVQVDAHAEAARKALETLADPQAAIRHAMTMLARIAHEDGHDRVTAAGLLLKAADMLGEHGARDKSIEEQWGSVKAWLRAPTPKLLEALAECGWKKTVPLAEQEKAVRQWLRAPGPEDEQLLNSEGWFRRAPGEAK